jgi:CRP/FNR family cyclic AMP-dependent transcriptional regulator
MFHFEQNRKWLAIKNSGSRRSPEVPGKKLSVGRRERLPGPLQHLEIAGPGRMLLDYRKRQPIFTQGEPANSIYYIDRGDVKLSVTSKTGKEAVVAILGAGDFFGEGGLAGTKVQLSSATAASDCRIVRMENRWIANLLHRDRAFSDFFMSYLLTRKARVEADLVDQLFNSSEKRLARALLVMARYGRDSNAVDTTLPKISQETLASMIGTTRSRVSYFMNKFRKLGFIRYNGEIQVRNSLVNILLHE